MKQFQVLADLIRYLRDNYQNSRHFNYRLNETWHSMSTEEFLEHVKFMVLGLQNMGVEKGDRIVIFSDSSPWWLAADFAVLLLSAVSVPIFAKISADNFSFEVEQTEPKWIFVAGEGPWEIIGKHPAMKEKTIALDPNEKHQAALTYEDVIEKGRQIDQKNPQTYETIEAQTQPEDVATIIYTSGSTGVPKGAVLTQRSVIGVAHRDVFQLRPGERYLNILPLAHIFARNVIYNVIAWGSDIYFVDDVKNVGFFLKDVKPHAAIVVPRLMEKIYSKMLAKVQETQSSIKRAIGLSAIHIAQQDDSFFKRLLVPIFDKLVYSKLRAALGGNIRGLLSGGAPLTVQLSQFFNTIGVPLFSGWGMTEGGCSICNSIKGNKYGTIGQSIDVAEIKINENGELCVRGHTVMKEYYKNPEKTKQAFDEEGWLKSGDKAAVDEEGYYTLIGRFKELYKTSTGEYIAPAPIEQELTKSPIIDMAMVVAEHRKYATCLLFPDFEVLENIKKKKKKADMSIEEFLHSSYIKRKMKELIEKVNKNQNQWEKICDYRFIPKTMTIEEGELTPTLKMKRDVIVNKYSHIIDSMYPEENK